MHLVRYEVGAKPLYETSACDWDPKFYLNNFDQPAYKLSFRSIQLCELCHDVFCLRKNMMMTSLFLFRSCNS